MQQGSNLSVWLAMVLVIVIWPLLFAGLWSVIVLLISRLGGWHRLARRYTATEPPSGKRTMRFATGMIGMSRYRRILTITIGEHGIFLAVRWISRIGHPTLFIPWNDIRNVRRINLFYRDFAAFDVGEPRLAGLRLPIEVFAGTPIFVN